jgi:hypothetical protein
MKITPFSPLLQMCDIEPRHTQANIEGMFEATGINTVSAVLTHRPDGGMIGSTHTTPYRIH